MSYVKTAPTWAVFDFCRYFLPIKYRQKQLTYRPRFIYHIEYVKHRDRKKFGTEGF